MYHVHTIDLCVSEHFDYDIPSSIFDLRSQRPSYMESWIVLLILQFSSSFILPFHAFSCFIMFLLALCIHTLQQKARA